MKKQYLETGKIVNTHGVRGEVKIQPWCDSPEFLCGFKTLYIDGAPVKLLSARVHKEHVIASLEGITDIDSAVRLKNRVVFIDRSDVKLPKGSYFIQDVIGIDALNAETGEKIGIIRDVMEVPSGRIFVIDGGREILVPDVPAFIKEVSIDGGYVKINMIEGM